MKSRSDETVIEPTFVKKYQNRKLYDTSLSAYVTFDDIAVRLQKGELFTVQCNVTKRNITNTVLQGILGECKFSNEELIAFIKEKYESKPEKQAA